MTDTIQQLDFSVNITQALLWQYNNADNLQSLINQKQDWYNENQQQFWQDFITNTFDLRTANEFGLKVWSIILDLPLFVNSVPSSPSAPAFGFNNGVFKNFNRGNFQSRIGSTANLSLETKRIALQLRYFQLTCSGTVPEINRFMVSLFKDQGLVFLIDNNDMTQSYAFLFPLSADLVYLFNNFDLLPRPAAVKSTYGRLNRPDVFGFNATYFKNFNRGNFAT